MTLREKFKPKVSINTDGEAGRYATKCEKIADDYAIEFAEWFINNGAYSYAELLEIFKKEKGL